MQRLRTVMNRILYFAGLALAGLAAGPVHAQPCEYAWAAVGEGFDSRFPISVETFAVFDDGAGPALYAGGSFETSGGVLLNNIARWDGGAWTALHQGVYGGVIVPTVSALAVYDTGSGEELFAGGRFTMAGSAGTRQMARWDGATWRAVSGLGVSTWIGAFQVFDDGTGPGLYVGGGRMSSAGGVRVNNIARWDGFRWSPLGLGVPSWVRALTVFDDGAGPNLYAGGDFTIASDVVANRVARWDGSLWWPLGSGMNDWVWDLKVFDDGTGPALYAGGFFTTAGGEPASHIARWDGDGWSPLGAGVNGWVYAMEVFDDGAGPALYVGGLFTEAGGEPASNIARWDGAAWSPVGDGMNERVRALAVFDDGSGPALYAGGEFTEAGGRAAGRIAKWSCQAPMCYPDCDDDGELTFFDFLCFQNEFAAMTPYADCDDSGGHDFFDFLCFQNAFAAGCP